MLNTIDFRSDKVHNKVVSHHAHFRGHSNKDVGKSLQNELRIHTHKPTTGSDYAYYKFNGNSAGNYHINDDNRNSDVMVDVFETDILRHPKPSGWKDQFNLVGELVNKIDEQKSFAPVDQINLGKQGW